MAPTTVVAVESGGRVRAIAAQVRANIAEKKVDAASAFAILQAAAELGASWDVVEDVLTELAKGLDGVEGTSDDLIPPTTVQLIRVMLRHGIVRDIATWAASKPAEAAGPQPEAWWRRLPCVGRQ